MVKQSPPLKISIIHHQDMQLLLRSNKRLFFIKHVAIESENVPFRELYDVINTTPLRRTLLEHISARVQYWTFNIVDDNGFFAVERL